MTVNLQQYSNASQANDLEQLRNAQNAQQQSQKISNQATDDALWRMAQNNEMAKIKGMSKLAETANQLGS
ncbi:hypothetical protein BCF11_2722 [Collimonas sp. PA-H2]|uniref:hypothetical protein n=1 Tax=Collimonas sp. PA-H2 TaxID=1881062 RepID=UPI000BF2930D|nr:hypothetical protein [Collimonas sp. PA-H2]PFH10304.1 hypothetical protein BCF11_2722 [Collimonas sp. PA-H2]